MLQNMREASKSWLMRGFFAILVFAFVFLWGISDVFKPGRMASHNVATVGAIEISASELYRDTKALESQYQSRTGKTPEGRIIQQSALQNLILNALLDQEADHLNLAISDKQLLDFVKNTPAFQNERGEFNPKIIEFLAHNQGLTVKGFEQELKKQLRRAQLTQMVTAGVSLPKEVTTSLYKWQNEKRVVDYAVVDPSSFNNLPEPTTVELTAYYEAHKGDFTKPEERDLTVALLSVDEISKKVTLSDEETQAGFAAKKDPSKSLPTRAESEKILAELKTEKAMDLFHTRISDLEKELSRGTPLEELVKEYDLKIIKIEGLTRSGKTRTATDASANLLQEVIEQGFKMETGDDAFLSQLNESTYVAVKLDKVYEPKLMIFEDVSKDIKATLIRNKQIEAAKTLATELVEKMNAGETIENLAKASKLDLKKNIAIERIPSEDVKIPAGLINIAFRTDLNKAALGPGNQSTYAIVTPRKIIHSEDKNITPEEFKTFSEALGRNVTSDMYDQYIAALERRYPVKINEAVLKAMQK